MILFDILVGILDIVPIEFFIRVSTKVPVDLVPGGVDGMVAVDFMAIGVIGSVAVDFIPTSVFGMVPMDLYP